MARFVVFRNYIELVFGCILKDEGCLFNADIIADIFGNIITIKAIFLIKYFHLQKR